MLDKEKIAQIAREVAKANLSAKFVDDALVEPTTDSEGREALRITVVIAPGAAARLKGDAVLDTLVQIQDRLRQADEDRFPIVEYATKEELENIGDPQS